jgi:PAS domain S-box-containing protein
MDDEKKSKVKLINELKFLRQKLSERSFYPKGWGRGFSDKGKRGLKSVPLKDQGQLVWAELESIKAQASFSRDHELIGPLDMLALSLERLNQAQETLRLSEEKFSKAFQASPLWMTLSALDDGRYLEINDTFLKITGYTRKEVLGKTSVELGLWADQEDRSGMMALLKKQGFLKNNEIIFYTKAGEPRNCLWFAELININGKEFIISEVLDITEQKLLKAIVTESEQRFRTLAEISPVGIFRTDMKGNYLYVNDRWSQITGIGLGVAIGKKWFHFLNQKDRKKVAREWKGLVAEGTLLNTEYQFGRKTEPDTWVLGSIIPEKGVGGQCLGYVGTITDISPLKRTEETLRETEKMYRNIFENAAEGIFQVTPEGRLVSVNKAAVRILGYDSLEEVMGTITDVATQVYVDPKARSRAVALLTRDNFLKDHEVLLRHKNSSEVWVSLSSQFVRNPQGNILYYEGTFRDISARKKAETALKKSEEKLRFLSNQLIMAQEKERKRIAIELHDELGQSLIGLKFQLSGFSRKLRSDQKALKTEIIQALKYINGMTENIRRITKDLHPAVLEHLGLEEALGWLLDEFGKYFQVRFMNGLRKSDGSFSKEQEVIIFRIFQEALTNIRKHAKATQVSIELTGQGKEAVFSIKDNGLGFDPKAVVSRNPSEIGLGLTAMGERARMAGGILKIRSHLGEGTAMTLRVPFDDSGAKQSGQGARKPSLKKNSPQEKKT